MTHSVYHIPALLPEAINLLNINPSGIYIDATFGGGGHSRAILDALGPEGHLYSFDRDTDAMANIIEDPRFTFVHSNFRYIRNFMRFYGVDKVDGILADLGVSFHHFDTTERGFSFRTEAPLDMRMNRHATVTAASIIAEISEEELRQTFYAFADLKKPNAIAKAIIDARTHGQIETTFQLAQAVGGALDPRQEKKELAQVFQALRIKTNDEMADLMKFLNATPTVLKKGGRLAILTYHSVEDRLVKNFMKSGNVEGTSEKDFFGHVSTPWRPVTRKPIEPSAQEIEQNPRSRSAKLRVAELI